MTPLFRTAIHQFAFFHLIRCAPDYDRMVDADELLVVLLDRFYDSITFLAGLRPARSVSLTHRPTSVPTPWSAHDAVAITQRAEVRAA